MRVEVYYNLHRKCWSVKALEGPNKGKVIHHCDTLHLRDVVFRVSETGRQRVLRERRKNVHAGVRGYLVEDNWTSISNREYGYNPYVNRTFVNKRTKEPIHYAPGVVMHRGRVYAIGGE